MNTSKVEIVRAGKIGVVACILSLASVATMAAAGEPHFICNSEPVPQGWAVTAVFPSDHCSNAGELTPTRLIESVDDRDAMRICFGSPVPNDWVAMASIIEGAAGECGASSAAFLIKNNQASSIRQPRSLGDKVTQAYGSEVSILLGAPIPTGWVIVMMGGGRQTIRDLNGARLNAETSILVGSPIPVGWVITFAGGGRQTIRYVNGSPYRSEAFVLVGSPIPENWVTVRVGAVFTGGAVPSAYIIANLNGARYADEVSVLFGSVIPTDWVIVGPTGGGLSRIRYLGGAPSGTEVQVLIGSPIPNGWTTIRSSGSSIVIRKL